MGVVTYFVSVDASGDIYVWREDEDRKDFPEPMIAERDCDDYLWHKLTEGMERR